MNLLEFFKVQNFILDFIYIFKAGVQPIQTYHIFFQSHLLKQEVNNC